MDYVAGLFLIGVGLAEQYGGYLGVLMVFILGCIFLYRFFQARQQVKQQQEDDWKRYVAATKAKLEREVNMKLFDDPRITDDK